MILSPSHLGSSQRWLRLQGFLTSVVGKADSPVAEPPSVPAGKAVMVEAESPWPESSGAAVEEEPASERADPVWPGKDTAVPFELDRPVEAGWPGANEGAVPLNAFGPLGEGRLDTEGLAGATERPVGDGLCDIPTEEMDELAGTAMPEGFKVGAVDAEMAVGLEDTFNVPEALVLTKAEDDLTADGLDETMFTVPEALLVLTCVEEDTPLIALRDGRLLALVIALEALLVLTWAAEDTLLIALREGRLVT